MSDKDRLEELLRLWEEEYDRGRDVPAAELAADCPHLIPLLEKEIAFARRAGEDVEETGFQRHGSSLR